MKNISLSIILFFSVSIFIVSLLQIYAGYGLSEYSKIDMPSDEKFEEISPQWKKDIKEEILKEVKMEMNEKFEELKKEYNAKFDISFLDEDIMEIGGHGQKSEE